MKCIFGSVLRHQERSSSELDALKGQKKNLHLPSALARKV